LETQFNKTILICLALLLLFSHANSNEKKLYSEFNEISFDAVEKEIFLDGEFPKNVNKHINYWFSNKIKVSGFEGIVVIKLYDYYEKISKINNGKKIDINISFLIEIKKDQLKAKKTVKGSISSYGSINGYFSLSDFDSLIYDTQFDLIRRLSKDLKNKI
jgi:hypothetical protein